MRTYSLARLLGVLGIVVLTLPGCGKGLGTLYPVSGKATVDGQPLKDAQLSFMADAEKGNKTAATPFGKIKDGSYSLTTKGKVGAFASS